MSIEYAIVETMIQGNWFFCYWKCQMKFPLLMILIQYLKVVVTGPLGEVREFPPVELLDCFQVTHCTINIFNC